METYVSKDDLRDYGVRGEECIVSIVGGRIEIQCLNFKVIDNEGNEIGHIGLDGSMPLNIGKLKWWSKQDVPKNHDPVVMEYLSKSFVWGKAQAQHYREYFYVCPTCYVSRTSKDSAIAGKEWVCDGVKPKKRPICDAADNGGKDVIMP